jgi:hypothetical protein
MTDHVTREEFTAKVTYLEREIDGEKMVTRYILEQTRQNSDDLVAIKTRLDRVEMRLDRVETRLDRLETKFDDHARTLPSTIAQVMREVLNERGGRT